MRTQLHVALVAAAILMSSGHTLAQDFDPDAGAAAAYVANLTVPVHTKDWIQKFHYSCEHGSACSDKFNVDSGTPNGPKMPYEIQVQGLGLKPGAIVEFSVFDQTNPKVELWWGTVKVYSHETCLAYSEGVYGRSCFVGVPSGSLWYRMTVKASSKKFWLVAKYLGGPPVDGICWEDRGRPESNGRSGVVIPCTEPNKTLVKPGVGLPRLPTQESNKTRVQSPFVPPTIRR